MSEQRNDTDRRAQVVEACDFAADSERLLRALAIVIAGGNVWRPRAMG